MSNIRYNIYPTLLDAFQIYLDADARAEEWWNIDELGNYRHTPQELSECAEQELIDTINRCREFDTTLADRGTCFNDIVRIKQIDFYIIKNRFCCFIFLFLCFKPRKFRNTGH